MATTAALPPLFDTAALPATFVIRDGKVLFQYDGAADYDHEPFREWLLALPR